MIAFAGPRDPEPRQVADHRIVDPQPALRLELQDHERRERLADRPDLEQRLGFHRPARADLGDPVGPADQQPLTVGHRQREPRDGPVGSLGLDLRVERGPGGTDGLGSGGLGGGRGHARYDGSMEPTRRSRRASGPNGRERTNGHHGAGDPGTASAAAPAPWDAVDVGALPRSRDAPRHRRRRRERPFPRPAGGGPSDPGGRGDGHDALRGRPAVRRPARGLEPRPSRRRPPDPARLPRGRLADHPHEHVRREPAAAQAQRPRGQRR